MTDDTITTRDLFLALKEMESHARERYDESRTREGTPSALPDNGEGEIQQWANGDAIAVSDLALKISQRVGNPAVWKAWLQIPDEEIAQRDLSRIMSDFMALEASGVRLANDTVARLNRQSEEAGHGSLKTSTDIVLAQRAAEDLVDELANVKASIISLLKLHPRE